MLTIILVCYIKRGIDYVPYDDTLIDFNQTYYVIRCPIECEVHNDPNNVPLILNFDVSDSEESYEDMPELEDDDDDDDSDDDSSEDDDDSSDDDDDSNDDDNNNIVHDEPKME